jgi:nicotinamidase-related amidase
VLIGGLVTNVCCESSARDACELGYQVTMVSDALVGHQFGLHEAALATFFRIFGDVRPSTEVVELLAAGATRSGPSRGP